MKNKPKEICPAPGCGREFTLDTKDYYWHLMTHDAKKSLAPKASERPALKVPTPPMPSPFGNLFKMMGINEVNLNNGEEVVLEPYVDGPHIVNVHLDIMLDVKNKRIAAIKTDIK